MFHPGLSTGILVGGMCIESLSKAGSLGDNLIPNYIKGLTGKNGPILRLYNMSSGE